MDESPVSRTRFRSRRQPLGLHQCPRQYHPLLPRALRLLCLANRPQSRTLDDLLTHPERLLHHLPQRRMPLRLMSMTHSTTVRHRQGSPRCPLTPSLRLLHDVLRMLPRRTRMLGRLLISRLLSHLLEVGHHLRHAVRWTHDRLVGQWTC